MARTTAKKSGNHQDDQVSMFGNAGQSAALIANEDFILENFLPFRVLAAAQTISRNLSGILSTEFDMSLAEWQVLAALYREDSVSVRELPPKTLLDTVAVSRAAQRLSDRRLVKKTTNANDKRLVVLKPTKKGRDKAYDIGIRARELENEILKGLSLQDRVRMAQMLKALMSAQT
ncbi:MAG: winged helix-turn-helix transcriptional regulator [Cohaesibacteraceae bacterium]|nr:winged helix-turn-helix transcriptional regulator [Cohaesibacteraceae bacterium]MBL4876709.1 winged helix-turn-helix transcriptional regulator [Cohaesibacteraceae bacterium]